MMGGICSLFRYVCSLVMPEGAVGLGGLVSPSVSINMHWDPIQRLKCACLCAHTACLRVCILYACLHDTAKQVRGYLLAGQGCYGDQWCQRGETSVGCWSRQVFLCPSLYSLSSSFSLVVKTPTLMKDIHSLTSSVFKHKQGWHLNEELI